MNRRTFENPCASLPITDTTSARAPLLLALPTSELRVLLLSDRYAYGMPAAGCKRRASLVSPGQPSMVKPSTERILNPYGRRHYRRTYSLVEVRVGLVILSGLASVLAWVVVRGMHPDPELFDNRALLDPGRATAVERGPLPEGLASTGYREGPIAHFGPDNLFEKINGRADFFKSRGFERLSFVSLQHSDPNRSVDVELYDMGDVQNALGTYASERAPDIKPIRTEGGTHHREASALFLVRGRHYVRAIAASGDAPVPAQLEQLLVVLTGSLEGAERPWSEDLFVEVLGLPAEAVGFVAANAFSFGFARGVHTARLPDGETDLFVVPTGSEHDAQALSRQFIEGFLSYGSAGEHAGQTVVTDRYLKRVAVAAAQGPFVVGVAAAPDPEAAVSWLGKLRAGLREAPAGLRTRALSEVERAAQNQSGDEVDIQGSDYD